MKLICTITKADYNEFYLEYWVSCIYSSFTGMYKKKYGLHNSLYEKMKFLNNILNVGKCLKMYAPDFSFLFDLQLKQSLERRFVSSIN